MPDSTTDLTDRVARLDWYVMALTIACMVLAVVAGTALAPQFVGMDAAADTTPDTIDVDAMHAGYLTAEHIIVKYGECLIPRVGRGEA